MDEKNGDCGTFLHGWYCSDEWMNTAIFVPFIDDNIEEIAKDMSKLNEALSFRVSGVSKSIDEVLEKINSGWRPGPGVMWVHPLLIAIKAMGDGWVVLAVDRVYNDYNFGDRAFDIKIKRKDGWCFVADL